MSTPPPLPPEELPTIAYASSVIPQTGGPWRRGDQLIAPRAISLPNQCVKCGAAETRRYQKDIYWHEPWVYVLILPGLLIYAIVALALRKKATYACGLCDVHARQRAGRLAIAWGLSLLSVALIVVGIMGLGRSFGRDWEILGLLMPLGFLILIVTAVFAAIWLPILKPKRIDHQYAYLAGAGEPFLRQFPDA